MDKNKSQWLDFNAFKCFENLQEQLNFELDNFGIKYYIKF